MTKVQKRPKKPAEIRAQMELLKTLLRQAEAREAERIGQLAIKAGLHEINLSDAEIVDQLKQLAARFCSSTKQPDTQA